MKLYGLQKLTLLDYPGKVACTIFTGGCNFRCPFCHNSTLVTDINDEDTYSEEELFDFLNKRKGLLDGVCITGGEPLLQPELENFIEKIKARGYLVKLDTNGSFPNKLQSLINKKLLDYVAMDIKNCKDKYGKTVGINEYDVSPIEKSICILKNGMIDYEFRTTVVKELHMPEDIEAVAKWITGAPRYFIQCFVDSGNTIKSGLSSPERSELQKMKELASKYIPNTSLRGI